MVGINGSSAARSALLFALGLSEPLDAGLLLTSVWTPDQAELPPDFVAEKQHDQRRALQREWSEPARRLGATFRSELLEGDPAEGLLASADAHDALVTVVGARANGDPAIVRAGSVADHLAHHTTRPLAVVPDRIPAGPVRTILLGVGDPTPDTVSDPIIAALADGLGADVVAVHVRDGEDPTDTLLVAAGDHRADLIVVGAPAVGGVRPIRLGGVPLHLLHRSDRPVLVVPHAA